MAGQASVSIHCTLPQHPPRVVGANEYQRELGNAKNKGQQLRVCFRVLSSMGYHANMDPAVWEKIREYLADYPE